MKEQSITFSPSDARAILDGRKTQTRRLLKGSTEFDGPYSDAYLEVHRYSSGWSRICPYGKPGDILRPYLKSGHLALKITNVRVQRLQEISEEDVMAEGVTPTMPIYGDCGGFEHQGGRDAFWRLWESIYGNGSWDANPWVWAISFRRLDA